MYHPDVWRDTRAAKKPCQALLLAAQLLQELLALVDDALTLLAANLVAVALLLLARKALLLVDRLPLFVLAARALLLLLICLRNVGSAAAPVMVAALRLAVGRRLDVLGRASDLGAVGVVLGHVARATAAGRVVFRLEGGRNEVLGGDVGGGVFFTNVAWGKISWRNKDPRSKNARG